MHGLRNNIAVHCNHGRGTSCWVFQSPLPGEIVPFVNRAMKRDTGLLQCAYITGDSHEDLSLRRQIAQCLRQRGFKSYAGSRIDHSLLKHQGPGPQEHHAVGYHQQQAQRHRVAHHVRLAREQHPDRHPRNNANAGR